MKRIARPVAEQDREDLVRFCHGIDALAVSEVVPRTRARVAGEVKFVRIVPRAGSPSLEVTVTDGEGQLVGVFFGRRKIPGIATGRRLVFEGMTSLESGRLYVYNPSYELLG